MFQKKPRTNHERQEFVDTIANMGQHQEWGEPYFERVLENYREHTTGSKGQMMSWTEFVAAEGLAVALARAKGKTVGMVPRTDLPPDHGLPWPEYFNFSKSREVWDDITTTRAGCKQASGGEVSADFANEFNTVFTSMHVAGREIDVDATAMTGGSSSGDVVGGGEGRNVGLPTADVKADWDKAVKALGISVRGWSAKKREYIGTLQKSKVNRNTKDAVVHADLQSLVDTGSLIDATLNDWDTKIRAGEAEMIAAVINEINASCTAATTNMQSANKKQQALFYLFKL